MMPDPAPSFLSPFERELLEKVQQHYELPPSNRIYEALAAAYQIGLNNANAAQQDRRTSTHDLGI